MRDEAYIYYIKNPVTKKIIYVGQTIYFESRQVQHNSCSHNEDLRAEILSIKSNALLPIYKIIETVKKKNAKIRENYWIAFYKGKGCPLHNRPHGRCKVQITGDSKRIYAINITPSIAEKAKARADKDKRSFSSHVELLLENDLKHPQI